MSWDFNNDSIAKYVSNELNKYHGIEITINSDLFDLDTMSDHLPVLFKTGLYNCLRLKRNRALVPDHE